MKTLFWVVAEVLLVFILLSLPGDNFSSHAKLFGAFPIDKLVHIILFVHFEGSTKAYLKTVRAKALVLIFCIVYGIGMEYYQKYFVPSRGFEVADMLADAVGAIIALPIFEKFKKIYAK
jgi:VanZ family protein